MGLGRGMLVGNAASGFFLVHAESVENPYVAARPFRVNAGAVHAYVLAPGGKTRYLNELRAGDETLIVGYDGRTEVAYIGRCKIERRPLLMVTADVAGTAISLVLQNAETIRLTRPDGRPVSVVTLGPGDEVLVHRAGGGRHFGMKIDETLREV
jgi:3-dehydroquinate synthase II